MAGKRIEGEIVDYRVRSAKNGEAPAHEAAETEEPENAKSASTAEAPADSGAQSEIQSLNESMKRPDELCGCTYKVKTPVSEHAMYITINDIVLNGGTEHEIRRPFEIFINSKNLDHFQWIVALTRIVSAVFRKGGDVTFLVEELKAVFDPRGGYWKTGGKFMPSLIAEIGEVIEAHMMKIGMITPKELSDHEKALLAEKRAQYEAANSLRGSNAGTTPGAGGSAATATQRQASGGASGAGAGSTGDRPADRPGTETSSADDGGATPFPDGATLCTKCNTAAVVLLDGCRTCLNCGDSKCG